MDRRPLKGIGWIACFAAAVIFLLALTWGAGAVIMHQHRVEMFREKEGA